MSLLTRLLEADNSSQAPANLAKPAKVSTRPGEVSQLSQLSQHPERKETTCTTEQLSQHSQLSQALDVEGATYARLLALAEREGRDAALVERIQPAELPEYAALSDAQLVALLSMLADTADREAGRVPLGDTAAMLCKHCGPVFIHPSIAGQLDKVNGWPVALGCPWCHVTMPEGHRLPRPRIESCTCTHWQPDHMNPPGGMGRCQCGHYYPSERHTCAQYQPAPDTNPRAAGTQPQ